MAMLDPEHYAKTKLPDLPPWWVLSRTALAELLGVSRQALASAAVEEEGPAMIPNEAVIRPKMRRFYRMADVRRWLDGEADPIAMAVEYLDRREVPKGDTLEERAAYFDRHSRGRRALYPVPTGYTQPRLEKAFKYDILRQEGVK
jgi:hypothetical protein